MDLLRSCYVGYMNFGDGAANPYKVKWYFTPPQAPYFPTFHLFGSRNWDSQGLAMIGAGEPPLSPQTYSRGSIPGNPVDPDTICGQIDWFVDQVPPGTPPLQLNGEGLPMCCYGGLPPPPACIPWNFFLFPDTRVATNEDHPGDWTEQIRNQSNLWYFNNVTLNDTVRFQAVAPACPPEAFRVRAQLLINVSGPTTIVNMHCVGYDAPTAQSLWQVPLTSPAYAGEIWDFVCPLH